MTCTAPTTNKAKSITAANYRPDVVLLDIGLADMDGWELAARFRQENPALIVAVTAFQSAEDRRESKEFAEKLIDVAGLYLNPPEHAIVLCVDDKSQIQALDRTQKSPPIYPGRLGTMTHDYKRNGTTRCSPHSTWRKGS